jgi:AraC-like DNA-binding protein
METLFRPGNIFPEHHQPVNDPNSTSSTSPAKRYSNYILTAIAGIKAHIDKDPFEYKTASQLLNHLNTPNRNTIEKAFKGLYGAGIKEYMVKSRLGQAKIYLTKDIPKKTIAHKCLYESLSAFSTAFRKEFGMSPTQWERYCQDNNTATNHAKT